MYLWCQNPTEVRRAAGDSDNSFRAIVHKLLINANIHTPIHERFAEMEMVGDEVLLLLPDQAHANLQPFIKVSADGLLLFSLTKAELVENMHQIDLSPCPDPNIKVGSVFGGRSGGVLDLYAPGVTKVNLGCYHFFVYLRTNGR